MHTFVIISSSLGAQLENNHVLAHKETVLDQA